jgi:hypothetical protein
MARQKLSKHFSFVSGFVENSNTLRFIGQADQLNEAEEPNSILFKWIRATNERYGFDLDWYATRMWVLDTPHLQVFVVGPDGRVNIGTLQGDTQEQIDASNRGPSVYGEIRDLRFIGNHLYAAGMGRQVYRRDGKDNWVHRDVRAIQPSNLEEVTGFNAIDGLGEEDIFAVGFRGEIWRLHAAAWRQVESPTNVILNALRVIDTNLMFACGKKGTLLRGTGDSWQAIAHESTDDEFWGLEWFNDALYVASARSLYRLAADDTLTPINLGLGKGVTCRFLHANDGVLLSVGTKNVCWTEDGVIWRDLAQ